MKRSRCGATSNKHAHFSIDKCVEVRYACRALALRVAGPVKIGSEELVTINQLVDLVLDIAGKRIEREHSGPARDVRPQVR